MYDHLPCCPYCGARATNDSGNTKCGTFINFEGKPTRGSACYEQELLKTRQKMFDAQHQLSVAHSKIIALQNEVDKLKEKK